MDHSGIGGRTRRAARLPRLALLFFSCSPGRWFYQGLSLGSSSTARWSAGVAPVGAGISHIASRWGTRLLGHCRRHHAGLGHGVCGCGHHRLHGAHCGAHHQNDGAPHGVAKPPTRYPNWIVYVRRKFRSQTSDNMDRWKAEQGRGREKRKIRREKIRRKRVRRKKMQIREKVGKSRNTVFFQWFVAPEGRKVGSLKRRVRSQLATGAMKNCTPLWREAHFQVKIYKTPQLRTTFGSWDVEKVHAVVARSSFPSQNVQNTPASDHFWKLRCRKSARRCGAKHISKWKCTKHLSSGPLLEVEMSKKCTPLWREAHFQVKMYKTHQRRTTFGSWDVEKVHAVVARSTFPSENVQNTPGPDHFWKLRCRKSARRCGAKHIFKSKVLKTGGLGPLLEVEMSKKCTPLWCEAHFEVKMLKSQAVRTTFGGSDVVSLRFASLY